MNKHFKRGLFTTAIAATATGTAFWLFNGDTSWLNSGEFINTLEQTSNPISSYLVAIGVPAAIGISTIALSGALSLSLSVKAWNTLTDNDKDAISKNKITKNIANEAMKIERMGNNIPEKELESQKLFFLRNNGIYTCVSKNKFMKKCEELKSEMNNTESYKISIDKKSNIAVITYNKGILVNNSFFLIDELKDELKKNPNYISEGSSFGVDYKENEERIEREREKYPLLFSRGS